jgi:hypothetical protein
MRIDEIELSKIAKEPSGELGIYKMGDYLERRGLKVLGYGAEAVVAMPEHGRYAIKIFKKGSKYGDFVRFAIQHQGNKHLPRFHRTVKDIPGTGFSYVTMGLLSPSNEDDLSDHFLPEMYGLIQLGIKNRIRAMQPWYATTINRALKDRGIDPFSMASGATFKKRCETKLGRASDQSWMQAVDLIMKEARKLGMESLDIHPDNLMMDGNTLVLPDPFFDHQH